MFSLKLECEDPWMPCEGNCTCIKQFLDNTEVGVRHTVVQGCVSIAVGHINYMLQH